MVSNSYGHRLVVSPGPSALAVFPPRAPSSPEPERSKQLAAKDGDTGPSPSPGGGRLRLGTRELSFPPCHEECEASRRELSLLASALCTAPRLLSGPWGGLGSGRSPSLQLCSLLAAKDHSEMLFFRKRLGRGCPGGCGKAGKFCTSCPTCQTYLLRLPQQHEPRDSFDGSKRPGRRRLAPEQAEGGYEFPQFSRIALFPCAALQVQSRSQHAASSSAAPCACAKGFGKAENRLLALLPRMSWKDHFTLLPHLRPCRANPILLPPPLPSSCLPAFRQRGQAGDVQLTSHPRSTRKATWQMKPGHISSST